VVRDLAQDTPKRRREPLSRERVLDAALALADKDGLEALTIRGLARSLGVEPMSIYHYAASRDEIVGAIVDHVVEQIELPPPATPWREGIRACAISAYRVLRLHPWACNLLMAGPRVSAPRLRQIDALLERLEAADLPPQLGDLAYHAIDSHILGFTLWEAGYTRGLPPLSGAELEAFMREIHLERYPHLQAHAAWHATSRVEVRPDEFEFKLDLILDGIERLRTSGAFGTADGERADAPARTSTAADG
jgi:AcrR family transcriptional regulator